MSIPVGVKTEIYTRVVGRTKFIVKQEWFLHPTKGWKRGPKRKSSKPVTFGEGWPRSSFVVTWKKW